MNSQTNNTAEAEIMDSLDSGKLPSDFKYSVSPEQYIENVTSRLGGLQKWLHDVEVSKIRKDHVIRVARAMFDFHYQDMQHVMVLGMDVAKKTRFHQYLQATAELSKAMQKQSAEAQLSVIGNLADQLLTADIDRNKRTKALEERIAAGDITQEQSGVHRQIYDKFYDELRVELDNTAKSMIAQHVEFLRKTMETFESTVIN